jgi:hypothetical protein
LSEVTRQPVADRDRPGAGAIAEAELHDHRLCCAHSGASPYRDHKDYSEVTSRCQAMRVCRVGAS